MRSHNENPFLYSNISSLVIALPSFLLFWDLVMHVLYPPGSFSTGHIMDMGGLFPGKGYK